MAMKAAIYKAELEIVDMDRNYYATHRLTLACHPSETAERLMIRLLAFALNAHERLEFGKGISDSDEPDLWQKDLAGTIELWIELGHPDERTLSRALGSIPSRHRLHVFRESGPLVGSHQEPLRGGAEALCLSCQLRSLAQSWCGLRLHRWASSVQSRTAKSGFAMTGRERFAWKWSRRKGWLEKK